MKNKKGKKTIEKEIEEIEILDDAKKEEVETESKKEIEFVEPLVSSQKKESTETVEIKVEPNKEDIEKELKEEIAEEQTQKNYKQYICVLLLFILSIVALIYMYMNIK